jgi:hypothetical protein
MITWTVTNCLNAKCVHALQPLMRHAKRITLALVIAAVASIALRSHQHRRDRALALPVIAELGGHVGSIPFEPFGTEYRISFSNRRLARNDLDRLAALAPLARRNHVGIAFSRTGVTADDILRLQRILPDVHFLPLPDAADEQLGAEDKQPFRN